MVQFQILLHLKKLTNVAFFHIVNMSTCSEINIFFFQSLLSDPNPNSPANSMAAQLYKENRREYEKRVKACVEQSFID